MKYKTATSILLLALFYSCGPSKATKQAAAERAALVLKQNQGEEIYGSYCARCHKLPDTKGYSITDWQPILKKMQPKAHLQDADMDKILAYLSK